VTGVLLYHLWPNRLPGGFVGVDVFFVVSGFLITSHLLSEVRRTGTIKVVQFWARRVRRLLPASLLVLLATSLTVFAWVPEAMWRQYYQEIIAATFYVENWSLAAHTVDYFAESQTASPVQHFWSLSVEEQFYLVWPLLIVSALWVQRRRGTRAGANAGLVTLAAIAAASFIASLVLTHSTPAIAYVATHSRAWEFAAGALFAYVTVAPVSARLRAIVAWSGIVAIAASFMVIRPETAFPAPTALLPVLGTLALLWAGNPATRLSPARLWSWRPVRWAGDASYSIYLWHWPLIVLVPFITGNSLGTVDKVVIVIVTLALAAATWRYVERAFRPDSAVARRGARTTFGVALGAMALVGAVAAVHLHTVNQNEAQAQEYADRLTEQAGDCYGATAIVDDGPNECDSQPPPADYLPATSMVLGDREDLAADGCVPSGGPKPRKAVCDFRTDEEGLRVALVGDSHAMHWFPAVYDIARIQGWYLTVSTQFACPWSSAVVDESDRADKCIEWNDEVSDHFEAQEPYDAIIATHRVRGEDPEIYGGHTEDQVTAGFADRIREQVDRGTEVIVLKDTPRHDEETMECLAIYADTPLECEVPVSEAFPLPDPMADAAADIPGASVIDMTSYFCDDGDCPTAIGSVIVLRDGQHLTATYTRTLTPYLWLHVRPAIDGPTTAQPSIPTTRGD
jgi:peptidoglycan/LPS O-acetylase OafA/YrhL